MASSINIEGTKKVNIQRDDSRWGGTKGENG